MNTQKKLEAWATVLGFAYDNLSGLDFDYLLDESPFSEFLTDLGYEDHDDWVEHTPFETHDMETTLYFK